MMDAETSSLGGSLASSPIAMGRFAPTATRSLAAAQAAMILQIDRA
jgi:hypothetical protein